MSRETEKIMRKLTEYLSANVTDETDMDDVNAMAQQFMEEYNASLQNAPGLSEPETADDFLEIAEQASSKKAKLKYIGQALELEPENLDALRLRAELTAKSPQDLLEVLPPIIEAATRRMRQDGSYEEMKGHFWGIIETRPYMRLRYKYLETLTECGMLRRAAEEGEELLALCEEDNLGVRYDLMHLYAVLEDEAAALTLYGKQNRDGENETQLLLPLSVLLYKRNRFDKALEYLKLLSGSNKDTKKFLGAVANDTWKKYGGDMSPYGYRPSCMDELIYAYCAFDYLYDTVPCFFNWAKAALTEKRGSRQQKK